MTALPQQVVFPLSLGDRTVAPSVASALSRVVGDEPGCVDQTARMLDEEHLLGTAMMPDPLPAAHAVREAVGPLGLDDDARRVLLVASVAVVDRTDVLLAASGIDIDTLMAGPAGRHLHLVGGRFRFHHPRIRSIVHEDADLATRTAAHVALSAVHRKADEPLIAIWHTSLSTLAGDPLLADGLVELAEQHLARGDVHRAHEVAREAASHGTDRVRARAFAVAGRAALWAGHVHDAVVHLPPSHPYLRQRLAPGRCHRRRTRRRPGAQHRARPPGRPPRRGSPRRRLRARPRGTRRRTQDDPPARRRSRGRRDDPVRGRRAGPRAPARGGLVVRRPRRGHDPARGGTPAGGAGVPGAAPGRDHRGGFGARRRRRTPAGGPRVRRARDRARAPPRPGPGGAPQPADRRARGVDLRTGRAGGAGGDARRPGPDRRVRRSLGRGRDPARARRRAWGRRPAPPLAAHPRPGGAAGARRSGPRGPPGARAPAAPRAAVGRFRSGGWIHGRAVGFRAGRFRHRLRRRAGAPPSARPCPRRARPGRRVRRQPGA